ncbi:histidine phosphatase family protein, partial [Cronobacter muytjensii]|nr:histidine phosphatase family protein [Cronobacter muytjensii]
MHLILIRHAETAWNRGGLIQGHQDSALAGAVIAKAQGKDALAGAAGASTGELTAKLALDLYGKKPEQLGEDERQLVSALSS